MKTRHVASGLVWATMCLGAAGCSAGDYAQVENGDFAEIAATVGVYQAEDFTSQSGCGKATYHAGYTGTGYMDYSGEGSLVEWNNVNAPSAGKYKLVFRYANGGASARQCEIAVNDTTIAGNVSFGRTGAWANWGTDSIEVNLKQGNNKIRVRANTGSGGPNLDKMDLTSDGTGATGGICAQVKERSTATLSCPNGQVINSITFASYGLPTGSCPSFSQGSCHASTSKSKVESLCLNKQSCSVAASNDVFGDPCRSTEKNFATVYTCSGGGGATCPSNSLKAEPGYCGCNTAEGSCCDTIESGLTTAQKTEVLNAIRDLENHIKGSPSLSDAQIGQRLATLQARYDTLGRSKAILIAANQLVSTYEQKMGPLWIGAQTQSGFDRGNWPTNIHTAIFSVMQAVIDRVYTAGVVGKCGATLTGMGFRTADYFPGKVTSIPNPAAVHKVKISASYPKTFGHPVMHAERPARKPTGTYLAPGTVATVTVPAALVNKGFAIRVGSHSWDLSGRPKVRRLDRVSTVYDIVNRQTLVANPLGGGIYIEVPPLANQGIVEVAVQNAVRSPYFSAKSFHTTSVSDWKTSERNYGAPWADFQSDKFMMQVPTSWISKLDDPVTLMKNWDMAMDALNALMGYPQGVGRETMYPQIDVINRASVYAPGYPSVNQTYDPTRDYGGNGGSYLVTGPQYVAHYEFHEQGHAFLFVKYGGEQESTVNLLHVAAWNQKFGYGLDEAFRKSRGFDNAYMTLDTTAVGWMTSFNFSPRKLPMAKSEKAYQLAGHAKFVDIARLFGWRVLNDFWYSINQDYENGADWAKTGSPTDKITLRLCEKAGVDLRPLLHFWGIHPENATTLSNSIFAKRLPASAKIYDALVRYKGLVPKDNAAFRDFALKWYGKQPSVDGYHTESEHARQWDSTPHLDKWPNPERPNGEMYTGASAADIQATVQEIVSRYFPNGRPQ